MTAGPSRSGCADRQAAELLLPEEPEEADVDDPDVEELDEEDEDAAGVAEAGEADFDADEVDAGVLLDDELRLSLR